ncbi:hypothetical protein SPMU_09930 [Sphingomonas mucosissima]|uniref:Uncharacterized protein n=1 Tax=Sphingomonas mucosissima TaxID=370959 RepID=A0A245ZSE1_9SPHN|nr:hypothetical protein SPMU_09930 [Sphingomonas mucosissima]
MSIAARYFFNSTAAVVLFYSHPIGRTILCGVTVAACTCDGNVFVPVWRTKVVSEDVAGVSELEELEECR